MTEGRMKRAYLLEYIDNKRDADYVWAGRCDTGEPMLKWKARIIKDHEEVLPDAMETWCKENKTLEHVWQVKRSDLETVDGAAIALFLSFQARENIYDVKLSSQTWLDGELVSEDFIEFPSTFYNSFAKQVNKEVMEKCEVLTKNYEALARENKNLLGFIRKYNAEQAYRREASA